MFLLKVERDEFGFRKRMASPFLESRIYAFKCMTWKVVRVLEGRCIFFYYENYKQELKRSRASPPKLSIQGEV